MSSGIGLSNLSKREMAQAIVNLGKLGCLNTENKRALLKRSRAELADIAVVLRQKTLMKYKFSDPLFGDLHWGCLTAEYRSFVPSLLRTRTEKN